MTQKIQLFLTVCITIITGMLLFSALRPQAPILQEVTIKQPEERMITVNGVGNSTLELDTVEFIIAIEATEEELADAKLKNETMYLDAIKILNNHAVEKKDIESDKLRLRTIFVGEKIYKYALTRLIKVTLHDLMSMEPIITDLQKAGLEQIEDINFSASKIDWYREQALQLAIQNAEQKAKATADALNRKIGDPISIQEMGSQFSPSPYINFASLDNFVLGEPNYGGGWRDNIFIEITITTQVTIKFELK